MLSNPGSNVVCATDVTNLTDYFIASVQSVQSVGAKQGISYLSWGQTGIKPVAYQGLDNPYMKGVCQKAHSPFLSSKKSQIDYKKEDFWGCFLAQKAAHS